MGGNRRSSGREAGAAGRRPTALRVGLVLLACLAMAACGSSEPEASADGRPLVTVSVAPQAYFVERLAGDRVRVAVLIPSGASPHAFEPTLEALRALHEAALVVTVGHPAFAFERAWIAPWLAERRDVRVVNCSAELDAPGEDPHVWLSPALMRGVAAQIETALATILPDAAGPLRTARGALDREIAALDADLRAEFTARRPARRFFVMHPAWGHFARDYGLTQVAIEAEGKEPDAARLAALIREARAAGVRTLFVQPQVDPRPARLVAEEIGARIEVLDPLARAWTENLRHAGARIAAALVP